MSHLRALAVMTLLPWLVLTLISGLGTTSLGQESPRQASPTAELMNSFHTIYADTGTWLAKPEMLQGALMKHPEFDFWGLSITSRGDSDVVLKIDHQPGWFYYTYSMTHRATGTVFTGQGNNLGRQRSLQQNRRRTREAYFEISARSR